MRYSRVYLDAIGYELAPHVVTTASLEARLAPLYERFHLPQGQLAYLTGIKERRFWEPDFPLSEGAHRAAEKALEQTGVQVADLGALIYAGVCREHHEPATACLVAERLGIRSNATVMDLSNACLGVLNGIVTVANMIELGQIRAGLVVSAETSRAINDQMIEEMLREMSLERFRLSMATLTGGSGAVAVVVTDGSFTAGAHRLVGGVLRAAPEHNGLCRWGAPPEAMRRGGSTAVEVMETDAVAVLKHGVALGAATWRDFLGELGWSGDQVDKVVCHQVGTANRQAVLQAMGIPEDRDFTTFEYLGNIGTVSLPLTAAIAHEREFLMPGDRVGFLGIGSGLNCLMLGWEW